MEQASFPPLYFTQATCPRGSVALTSLIQATDNELIANSRFSHLQKVHPHPRLHNIFQRTGTQDIVSFPPPFPHWRWWILKLCTFLFLPRQEGYSKPHRPPLCSRAPHPHTQTGLSQCSEWSKTESSRLDCPWKVWEFGRTFHSFLLPWQRSYELGSLLSWHGMYWLIGKPDASERALHTCQLNSWILIVVPCFSHYC